MLTLLLEFLLGVGGAVGDGARDGEERVDVFLDQS